jgi:hypothetical protein
VTILNLPTYYPLRLKVGRELEELVEVEVESLRDSAGPLRPVKKVGQYLHMNDDIRPALQLFSLEVRD